MSIGIPKFLALPALLLLAALLATPAAWAQDADAETEPAAADSAATAELTPLQLAALRRDLQRRRSAITDKAIAYLWDQRLNTETGTIGTVQPRFLQALTVLALAADGRLSDPAYQDRLARIAAGLAQPLERLNLDAEPAKLYVGTSNDVLAFETHAVVALAYQQLAVSGIGDAASAERYQHGTAGAIAYILDYRKRGRTYETAGGWPVNAMAYNRNRPDRRVTAWQLMLLQAHGYTGADTDPTALTEAPQFILAAQRLAPPMDAELEKARDLHAQYAPALRRGEPVPPDVMEPINKWLAYERQVEEAGGFGVDTIGIVTPSATAVGLWTLGAYEPEQATRYQAAVDAFTRMPLAWDSQRFFLTQFFATRGLLAYTRHYDTQDYWLYLNRLVTLMEQQQNADGSFPLGSRGVEELNQMESVYTTAMCILILNADRGTLLVDRPAY